MQRCTTEVILIEAMQRIVAVRRSMSSTSPKEIESKVMLETLGSVPAEAIARAKRKLRIRTVRKDGSWWWAWP